MADKITIQITNIYCYGTSEAGHDEVYLLCQADAGFMSRYPSKLGSYMPLSKGDKWHLAKPNLYLEFENDLLITLWDQDLKYDPSVATYLISYDYNRDNLAQSKSIRIKNPNGAEYQIDINLVV